MFMIYMRLLKNKILVSKIVHEDIKQVHISVKNNTYINYNYNETEIIR